MHEPSRSGSAVARSRRRAIYWPGRRALPLLLLLQAWPAAAEDGSSPAGHELGLAYTIDTLGNLSGGIRKGTAVLGKLDASASMDGDELGLAGASAFVNLQFVHGRQLSAELVGDVQVVSNIEAVSALRPLEAWIEFALVPSARLKLGLIDLNSEFDSQPVGSIFLNSSHGIGPDFSQTGENGPSIFPTTASAAVLDLADDAWTVRLGLFDAVAGDPDHPSRIRIRFPGETGLLVVAEGEIGLGEFAAKAGVWHYTGRFDALEERATGGAPKQLDGNRGGYMHLQGRLMRRHRSSLDAWIRVGKANQRIHPIAATVGGGLTWGNEDWCLGLAVSRAMRGDPAIRLSRRLHEPGRRAETAFEFTYARRLSRNVIFQPDLQFIRFPGWGTAGHALVAGFRLILETSTDM